MSNFLEKSKDISFADPQPNLILPELSRVRLQALMSRPARAAGIPLRALSRKRVELTERISRLGNRATVRPPPALLREHNIDVHSRRASIPTSIDAEQVDLSRTRLLIRG